MTSSQYMSILCVKTLLVCLYRTTLILNSKLERKARKITTEEMVTKSKGFRTMKIKRDLFNMNLVFFCRSFMILQSFNSFFCLFYQHSCFLYRHIGLFSMLSFFVQIHIYGVKLFKFFLMNLGPVFVPCNFKGFTIKELLNLCMNKNYNINTMIWCLFNSFHGLVAFVQMVTGKLTISKHSYVFFS